MSNSSKAFPYEIKDFDESIIAKYPDLKDIYISVGPKKYSCFKLYQDDAEVLYNFDVRPDDVWIFGIPRSGTTVVQEIVWLLENDLNYEKAAEKILDIRFPVFERAQAFKKDHERILSESHKYSSDIIQIAQQLVEPTGQTLSKMTERRFIKTHLPLSLGPKILLESGCKVIYVARNPKDVCISNYELLTCFESIGVNIKFEVFWEEFKQGLIFPTPYFEHVKEGWELRNHENVLFLYYDEYLKNIRETLVKVAAFFGKELTGEQLNTLENHLSIENFRKNKSVNNDHLRTLGIMKNLKDRFIRRGKIGGWRDYFTAKLKEDADKWIEENLKDTDLKSLIIS